MKGVHASKDKGEDKRTKDIHQVGLRPLNNSKENESVFPININRFLEKYKFLTSRLYLDQDYLILPFILKH